jgi:hypothetical protein
MIAGIYNIPDGKIRVWVQGPPNQISYQCSEGEAFYLNCPSTATHIINNEPVTIVPEPIPPTEAEITSLLWEAAHKYEYAQISGSAVGMLALGVIQQLPKSLAVAAWIQGIWTLYYNRKAEFAQDYDYSSCGQIPFSVPEVMQELGL